VDRICCGVSHKTSALGCRLSRLREGVESASLSFLSRGMCARRKVLDVEEQVLRVASRPVTFRDAGARGDEWRATELAGAAPPPRSPRLRGRTAQNPSGDGKGGSSALTERHRSILDPRFACLQATRDDRFNAPVGGLSARCGPFWRRDPAATVPIDPATCRVCALGATQTGRIEACQPLTTGTSPECRARGQT